MPRPRISRSVRRKSVWVGPADQGFINVGAGASVLVDSFIPDAAGMLRPTVARVRGQCALFPTVASADISITGAFGIAIVSAQAFVAGAGSIPRPFDDADWSGWFVWRSFNYRYEFHTAASSLLSFTSFEVDSKAMRKIAPDEVIVAMCESQSGAFQFSAPLRTLLLMS